MAKERATFDPEQIKNIYFTQNDDPFRYLTVDSELNIVENLIYWRSPLGTGLTLLCLNIFALLVTRYHYSSISLLAYIMFAQLLACFMYVQTTRLYLIFHGHSASAEEITRHDGPLFDARSVEVTMRYLTRVACHVLLFIVNIYRCANTTRAFVSLCFLILIAQIARVVPTVIIFALLANGVCVWGLLSRSEAFQLQWARFLLFLFEAVGTRHEAAAAAASASNTTFPRQSSQQSKPQAQ